MGIYIENPSPEIHKTSSNPKGILPIARGKPIGRYRTLQRRQVPRLTGPDRGTGTGPDRTDL